MQSPQLQRLARRAIDESILTLFIPNDFPHTDECNKDGIFDYIFERGTGRNSQIMMYFCH